MTIAPEARSWVVPGQILRMEVTGENLIVDWVKDGEMGVSRYTPSDYRELLAA